MTKVKPTTVDEYIDAAPAEAQKNLRELRAILKKVAPAATEVLKWGMPVMEEKRILFSYAAFKKHINFMPTHLTMEAFEKELADFEKGKGSIQLPHDKPLPKNLIKKVATHRAKDVKENDAKWMY